MYLDHIHPPHSLAPLPHRLIPYFSTRLSSVLLLWPSLRHVQRVHRSMHFIGCLQEYGWGLVYRTMGTLPVAPPLEKILLPSPSTVNCVHPQGGVGSPSCHDGVLRNRRSRRSYTGNHSYWSLGILIVTFWIMLLSIAPITPIIRVKILITLSVDLHAGGRSVTPLPHGCLFSHPFCSSQRAQLPFQTVASARSVFRRLLQFP